MPSSRYRDATSTVPSAVSPGSGVVPVGCVDTGGAAGASPVSVLVQLHSLVTARASLTSPYHLSPCSVAWLCLILPSCNQTEFYPES